MLLHGRFLQTLMKYKKPDTKPLILGFPESACSAGEPGSVPGSGRSPGEGKGRPLQHPWASLVAQLVKNPPAMWKIWVRSLGWKDPWRRERLPTPVFWPGEFHGLYSSRGLKESDMTSEFHFCFILDSTCMKHPEWANLWTQ